MSWVIKPRQVVIAYSAYGNRWIVIGWVAAATSPHIAPYRDHFLPVIQCNTVTPFLCSAFRQRGQLIPYIRLSIGPVHLSELVTYTQR